MIKRIKRTDFGRPKGRHFRDIPEQIWCLHCWTDGTTFTPILSRLQNYSVDYACEYCTGMGIPPIPITELR